MTDRFRTPEKQRVFPSLVPNTRAVDTNQKVLVKELLQHTNSHELKCKELIKLYQRLCKKNNKSQTEEGWSNAKTLIKAFFPSVQFAREYIERIEQENPNTNLTQSLALNNFEQITIPILHKYDSFESLKQEKLLRIINTFHDDWKMCHWGRWLYRSQCEENRDSGHAHAYYLYKIASLISNILKSNTNS